MRNSTINPHFQWVKIHPGSPGPPLPGLQDAEEGLPPRQRRQLGAQPLGGRRAAAAALRRWSGAVPWQRGAARATVDGNTRMAIGKPSEKPRETVV